LSGYNQSTLSGVVEICSGINSTNLPDVNQNCSRGHFERSSDFSNLCYTFHFHRLFISIFQTRISDTGIQPGLKNI
jgi:hypothetical protein